MSEKLTCPGNHFTFAVPMEGFVHSATWHKYSVPPPPVASVAKREERMHDCV